VRKHRIQKQKNKKEGNGFHCEIEKEKKFKNICYPHLFFPFYLRISQISWHYIVS